MIALKKNVKSVKCYADLDALISSVAVRRLFYILLEDQSNITETKLRSVLYLLSNSILSDLNN